MVVEQADGHYGCDFLHLLIGVWFVVCPWTTKAPAIALTTGARAVSGCGEVDWAVENQ